MYYGKYYEEIFIFMISLLLGFFLTFVYFSTEFIEAYHAWLRDIFEFSFIFTFIISIFAVVGYFKRRHEFMLPLMIFCVVFAVFAGCNEIYNSFACKTLDFGLLLLGLLLLGIARVLVYVFHKVYNDVRNMSLAQYLTILEDIRIARIETNNTVFVPPNHNPPSYADVERSVEGAYYSATAAAEDNPPNYEELERIGLLRNN